eukprot:CAMPEP_0172178832 /NCGR_PEP_ID=MMETSP1050-20130122/16264_1 /TAXON_ID=233186 /ORGANISM="Cryptomonas curvata, Strain CCAP979/52" /LENGTH=389 /DNA_ID=CAMNT_0012851613 /DNA_START=95 /DNA_END=1260 /DNA_ORIENTATION=+
MSADEAGYQQLAQNEEKKRMSPAFLSPRMWDPEGSVLPPSTEVPHRPTTVGRTHQDTACFGLFCFIMALFLFQGLSAILSANYQLPHDFEKCEKRVIENSMPVARIIPQEEIDKYKEDQAAQARHSRVPVLKHESHSGISHGNVPHHSRALLDLSMADLKEVIGGLLEGPMLEENDNETEVPASNISVSATTPAASPAGAENITESDGVLNRIAAPLEQAALNATGAELDAALERLWSICYQSWNIICLLAVGSMLAGMFWVWLLEDFTYPVLLLTVGLLPLAIFSFALWAFFTGYSAALYLPLFVAFALSLVFLAYLSEKLKFSAAIIGCASKVLRRHPSVIFLGIFISLVQVVWFGVCFLFIGLSFMSGEAVEQDPIRYRADAALHL